MKRKNDLDYKKYDSLSIALKSDALEKMLEFYQSFGWREYERREDSRYFDIVHVELYREHNIPNKDKLQLLQIRMENAVNKFAGVRRQRHAKSLALALTTGIGGAFLAVFGVMLSIKYKIAAAIIAGSAIAVFGVAAPLLLIPKIKKMFKRENLRFMLAYREMGAVISRTVAAAERLGGCD